MPLQNRVSIRYRVGGVGPCLPGWIDLGNCPGGQEEIHDAVTNLVVAGAVIANEGDCPAEVTIVGPVSVAPAAPTPVTATGQDCAGAAVTVTGVGVVQTVPAPGAVQMVKICPDPTAPLRHDREFSILCAPDGTKVAVQNVTPIDAPLGTAPVFEAYTFDGQAYTDPLRDLRDCGQESLDLTDAEWFCDGGVSLSRVTVWNLHETPPAIVGVLWQDAAGNFVTPPSNPVPGACAVENKQLTYAERNGGTVTMADIVAATGGLLVQSVTVTQVSGVGAIGADYGSGIPLYTGETQTWSAFGESGRDSLNASGIKMDAGGGEQHITALVVAI